MIKLVLKPISLRNLNLKLFGKDENDDRPLWKLVKTEGGDIFEEVSRRIAFLWKWNLID